MNIRGTLRVFTNAATTIIAYFAVTVFVVFPVALSVFTIRIILKIKEWGSIDNVEYEAPLTIGMPMKNIGQPTKFGENELMEHYFAWCRREDINPKNREAPGCWRMSHFDDVGDTYIEYLGEHESNLKGGGYSG